MDNNFPLHFEDVDKEIYRYLNLDSPTSFLLFAGAGSGKTRTLVNVLEHVKQNDLHRYIDIGAKIAVITYTNAACDEIKHRLQFDPAFKVSTIHSFAWDLIKPFTQDIREFLKNRLTVQIRELDEKIGKARDPNGKTAVQNAKSRDSKINRLKVLDSITEFTYSPTSGKPERDALNHTEVIAIASEFIANSPLMHKLLTNRFPVLLIDESQDTDKHLMNALIIVQKNYKRKFALGLFGDMMQRIYGGGKEDLDSSLPDDWEQPAKLINYRCPKRIVTLINAIRFDVDKVQQEPKDNATDGLVRLFIVDAERKDKFDIESSIRESMRKVTGDDDWGNIHNVKCLTLEHAMAADRDGFAEFFVPLAKNADLKDSVLNGTSQELQFIVNLVLPLFEAIIKDDHFEIARFVKLGSKMFCGSNQNLMDFIISADERIEEFKLRLKHEDLSLRDVIDVFDKSELLDTPDKLKVYLEADIRNFTEKEQEDLEKSYVAWGNALQAKMRAVKSYSNYISEESSFATHQGVKGLEFERVMAILDDESAGGFLFNYEKLLGAEPLSANDLKNEADGKDSAPLRTRRLFYVICSRAEKSLAIVAYTKNPKAVEATALQSWFKKDEVVLI
ncbi:UvrD-helicase domain-containing protein [Pseudoalteromonas xiamenensis]|uniref:UvrD-helicase domain-containing protein n=1 Tax=Pseudoalteromonas TaxID=53246 RepID=UPI001EFC36A2|nr:UvrD-helicase domain-containing protein [Pseudoalteromonas sp. Isolate3]